MPARPRIEALGVGALVYDLALKGVPQAEIARRLREEHGVAVSQRAVSRYLRRVTRENRERSQAVIAERQARMLPKDLDLLDSLETALVRAILKADQDGKLEQLVHQPQDFGDAVSAAHLLLKLVKTRHSLGRGSADEWKELWEGLLGGSGGSSDTDD